MTDLLPLSLTIATKHISLFQLPCGQFLPMTTTLGQLHSPGNAHFGHLVRTHGLSSCLRVYDSSRKLLHIMLVGIHTCCKKSCINKSIGRSFKLGPQKNCSQTVINVVHLVRMQCYLKIVTCILVPTVCK